MTQKQLAVQLNVRADTVRNWEQGRHRPALRVIPAIAKFIGERPMPVAESFGDRLRYQRKLAGLSQARLAIILGVDEGTVNGWEKSRHRPTKAHQEQVETVLAALVERLETQGGPRPR